VTFLSCELVEETRQRYRPHEVKALFVGESAPAGGTFFYCGNSNLAFYTREAFEAVLGSFGDMSGFLQAFRDRGYYLLDLCPEPVNHLDRRPRRAARKAGIPYLASAMSGLRPAYVVVVMKEIQGDVAQALSRAGLGDVETQALPFPAQGNQPRYVAELIDLLRKRNPLG